MYRMDVWAADYVSILFAFERKKLKKWVSGFENINKQHLVAVMLAENKELPGTGVFLQGEGHRREIFSGMACLLALVS